MGDAILWGRISSLRTAAYDTHRAYRGHATAYGHDIRPHRATGQVQVVSPDGGRLGVTLRICARCAWANPRVTSAS